MSIQQTQGDVEQRLSDKEVEQFLRRQPEFFENHSQLLSELRVPHNTNGAVSLVERQVDVLRGQNKKLKKQLDDLLRIARSNDKLGKQIYKLTLALLATDNLDELLNLLQVNLRRDFSADALSLKILARPIIGDINEHHEFVPNSGEMRQLFAKLLKDGRSVCGQLDKEQRTYLFGDQAEKVRSLAWLPLKSDTAPQASFGVLAIGSHEEKRFHSGMGTVYLSQMAALISKALLNYMDPV